MKYRLFYRKKAWTGTTKPLPCCSQSTGSSRLEATSTSAVCVSRLVLPIFVVTCLEDLPTYDVAKVPLSGMDCLGGPCPALRFCRTRENASLAGDTGVLSELSSSDSVFPLLRCFAATDSFWTSFPARQYQGCHSVWYPFVACWLLRSQW